MIMLRYSGIVVPVCLDDYACVDSGFALTCPISSVVSLRTVRLSCFSVDAFGSSRSEL